MVMIPMALPLTILLASVMVYGDMAEKYELSSAKSAGVSLVRLLFPGLAIAILVAFLSLFASNFLRTVAFQGWSSKMKAMKTNKLTFAFDENIFNNDFKNYAIRIGEKDKDGRSIKDILIYDYSDSDKSVTNFIQAQGGEMYTSPDKRYLIMDLYDGYIFEEIRGATTAKSVQNFKVQGRPVLRYNFSSLRKVFDLEEVIDLSLTGASYRKYEMMNSLELLTTIDSLENNKIHVGTQNIHPFSLLSKTKIKDFGGADKSNIERSKAFKKDRTEKLALPIGTQISKERITEKIKSLEDIITLADSKAFYDQALKTKASMTSRNGQKKHDDFKIKRDIANHKFALHRMYSWALVCIIFLFIGGPAGAIVRKGGFGYPMLIAIGFYLAFVMTSIVGDKLVKSGSLEPVIGAWLPCLILLPFAVYLTWRAMLDNRPVIKWRSPSLRKSK